MPGYAAPKVDVIGVRIIGLGSRGSGMARSLTRIEGVEVKALCDLLPEAVNKVVERNNQNTIT